MRVPEVADLFEGLPRRDGVDLQRGQVDGRGRVLLVGAVVVSAEAVHSPMQVLQVDLLIVLSMGEKQREGG